MNSLKESSIFIQAFVSAKINLFHLIILKALQSSQGMFNRSRLPFYQSNGEGFVEGESRKCDVLVSWLKVTWIFTPGISHCCGPQQWEMAGSVLRAIFSLQQQGMGHEGSSCGFLWVLPKSLPKQCKSVFLLHEEDLKTSLQQCLCLLSQRLLWSSHGTG